MDVTSEHYFMLVAFVFFHMSSARGSRACPRVFALRRGPRGQQRAKAKAPAGTSGQAQDGHRISGDQPRQSGTGAAAGNKGKGRRQTGTGSTAASRDNQAPGQNALIHLRSGYVWACFVFDSLWVFAQQHVHDSVNALDPCDIVHFGKLVELELRLCMVRCK